LHKHKTFAEKQDYLCQMALNTAGLTTEQSKHNVAHTKQLYKIHNLKQLYKSTSGIWKCCRETHAI